MPVGTPLLALQKLSDAGAIVEEVEIRLDIEALGAVRDAERSDQVLLAQALTSLSGGD